MNDRGGKKAGSFLLERRLGRILTGMKRWHLVLITVSVGLAIVIYIVSVNGPMNFADLRGQDNQAKNRQSDGGRLLGVNAVPKEVLMHRQAHQLRPLTEREDGTKLQELPNGVYGFSMCNAVSLSAKRGNTASLELHKHDDGIVYYVGYAPDEQIEKYLTQQHNFHILTSPHPREQASSLFEIPVAFVSKCEERPVGEGYLFDLFVTTIPISQS
jgi:hypothetical protein